MHKLTELGIQPYIADEKLTHYLLAQTHVRGKSKAVFFERWQVTTTSQLKEIILAVWLNGVLTKEEETDWGNLYVIIGDIPFPNGRIGTLKTVWIVKPEMSLLAKFVTAHPHKP